MHMRCTLSSSELRSCSFARADTYDRPQGELE
jgi:hypothetical protein